MRTWLVAALLALGVASPAQAAGGYSQAVTETPGLVAYWRLGTTAPGTLLGGASLGAHGALSGAPAPSALLGGIEEELKASPPAAATVEGWFFWEAGVAVLRDDTSAGGWILAFDSGGRVASRAGGTTVTTTLATSDLRDGWHYLALTVQDDASAFY